MDKYKTLDVVAGSVTIVGGLFLTLYGLTTGTLLPLNEGVDPFWFRIGQVGIGLLMTYAGYMTKGVSEMIKLKK
jgi:hypothetical protein